jgi:aldehyde dehydrogenase (NAD+)
VIDLIKPSTNESIARVRQRSVEDYQRALDSSLKPFQIWSNVPAPKRGDIVRQIRDELRKYLQPLGKLVR